MADGNFSIFSLFPVKPPDPHGPDRPGGHPGAYLFAPYAYPNGATVPGSLVGSIRLSIFHAPLMTVGQLPPPPTMTGYGVVCMLGVGGTDLATLTVVVVALYLYLVPLLY